MTRRATRNSSSPARPLASESTTERDIDHQCRVTHVPEVDDPGDPPVVIDQGVVDW